MGECADNELKERAKRADRIVRNPRKYKVCEGCDSIVLVSVATCPNCHAYRFIEDPNSVINQARELGQREQRSVMWSDLE